MDKAIEQKINIWLGSYFDDNTRAEIKALIDAGDEAELVDRFYKDLEFGTGGLRGKMGAGTNRMNRYVVRRATAGLAMYLLERHKNPSVAIGYDSRNNSSLFAQEAASVLCGYGIKVYLYPSLRPTPMVSFAVRYYRASAGIVITASHNPKEYNGYKVFGEDGAQITSPTDKEILSYIDSINDFSTIKYMDIEEAVKKELLQYISSDVDNKYYYSVFSCLIEPYIVKEANLRVVYTPLNGSGLIPVKTMLNRLGVKELIVVKEQEAPDGNFPTIPYPNPEEREAIEIGMSYLERYNADLLIATDPDADRMGVVVRHGNENIILNGNQTGVIMLNYLLEKRNKIGDIKEGDFVVKTIVTTSLADKIAKDYNVECFNVLTGFKYIGMKIRENEGKRRFLFGFEESYGYLAGDYVRDKDSVVASSLICEIASYCKKKGITLVDYLYSIYEKYGIYLERLSTFKFEGIEGHKKMNSIIEGVRNNPPQKIEDGRLKTIMDVKNGYILNIESGNKEKIDLPPSNVIALTYNNNFKAVIRPSGTEPKIKVYFFLNSSDTDITKGLLDVEKKLDNLARDFMSKIGL